MRLFYTIGKLGLLALAWVLKAILSPVLFIWGIVRSIWKREFAEYCYDLAVSIDCFGNVLGKYAFNDTMQKNGYRFGDRLDTISYVIGRNSWGGTLTKFGNYINDKLNYIDPQHTDKALVAGDDKISGRVV